MEDGKYRHLYQLEEKKEEILRSLPEESLKDHLEFMKLNIKGRKFPLSIISCCLSNKYKLLSSEFTESFESLEIEDKIIYYRKYIDTAFSVSKRTIKMPTLSKLIQENPSGRQSSSVLYRMSRFDGWRTTMATLDHNTKILETLTMSIDLHRTFVGRPTEKTMNQDLIFIIPWKDHLSNLQLMKNQLTSTNFFQRIEYLADLAIEDNIIKTIQGEVSAQSSSSEHEDRISSDRSIKNRMLTQTHLIARQTIREVNQINSLQYRHPVEPLQRKQEYKRLVPQKNIHYFFQGEWQINSDGQLIAINAKKLEAQGSVMKYVIKRIFTGDKIFSISLPVSVFNEESNLSQLINSYRSAPLELQPAALQQNPLKRFLKVIKFAFTCPLGYIRCDKPFNPILGETYQSMVNGTLFYGQQISHHPPISSVFIKGRGYTAYGSFEAEVKFGLNSASGNNKGWFKISFDPDNISKKVVRFSNPPGEMSGMLFGSRKLNLKEKIRIIDEQNLIYCQIAFGEVKLQKGKQYSDSIEGKVVKLKRGTLLTDSYELSTFDIEQDYGLISGRWLSQIYFNRELLINTIKQYPPEVERYPALLPSDYSLREDVILKKKGDQDHCQAAKEELEEIQRNDRKLREKYRE